MEGTDVASDVVASQRYGYRRQEIAVFVERKGCRLSAEIEQNAPLTPLLDREYGGGCRMGRADITGYGHIGLFKSLIDITLVYFIAHNKAI